MADDIIHCKSCGNAMIPTADMCPKPRHELFGVADYICVYCLYENVNGALRTLWGIGLAPTYHAELTAAAKGATDIVTKLRDNLKNPPADVREAIIADYKRKERE